MFFMSRICIYTVKHVWISEYSQDLTLPQFTPQTLKLIPRRYSSMSARRWKNSRYTQKHQLYSVACVGQAFVQAVCLASTQAKSIIVMVHQLVLEGGFSL